MGDYVKELRALVGSKPLLLAGVWLLVVNERGEVLMQKRSDFHSWDFPGGTMELAETVRETATRELKEETNLELEDLRILDVFSGPDTYREYPGGDAAYVVSVLCRVDRFHGELGINDGESTELKWFAPADIPSDLSPVTVKFIDRIRPYLES